jgi:ABC-type transport system substrate-binding protein
MNIAPRESEDKFDMKSDARGISPWYITEYRPSASISYRRNPNWYMKDRPFLDGVDVPIVQDYSNRLSQFKAKNIWSHVANKPDVVQLKKDHPELKLFRGDFGLSWAYLQFGFDPNNPYEDERVRQAFSMAIDRDLFLDTFEDTKSFAEAGIPLEVRWNTALSSGWEGYWVDPKGKDFGPNAKYYKHDVAEGKKLLSAAGKDGLETVMSWAIASSVGPSGPQRAEVLAGMLEQLGVKVKRNVVETALFTPNYAQHPERNFVGMAFGSKASSPDPAIQMYYNFHGDSSRRVMKKGADPEQDALIVKMRTEPDLGRRRTLIQELQRVMAKRMWAVPQPGLSGEVSLSWPFVMNEGVYYPWVSSPSLPAHVFPNLWIDKSKAPA